MYSASRSGQELFLSRLLPSRLETDGGRFAPIDRVLTRPLAPVAPGECAPSPEDCRRPSSLARDRRSRSGGPRIVFTAGRSSSALDEARRLPPRPCRRPSRRCLSDHVRCCEALSSSSSFSSSARPASSAHRSDALMGVPPGDQECCPTGLAKELADRRASVERKNPQLKKSLFDPKPSSPTGATAATGCGRSSRARRGRTRPPAICSCAQRGPRRGPSPGRSLRHAR